MIRLRRIMMALLMVVSLGLLVGDDCEFEMEDFHWPHWDDDVIIYDPGYYVVPVYPEPYFW